MDKLCIDTSPSWRHGLPNTRADYYFRISDMDFIQSRPMKMNRPSFDDRSSDPVDSCHTRHRCVSCIPSRNQTKLGQKPAARMIRPKTQSISRFLETSTDSEGAGPRDSSYRYPLLQVTEPAQSAGNAQLTTLQIPKTHPPGHLKHTRK